MLMPQSQSEQATNVPALDMNNLTPQQKLAMALKLSSPTDLQPVAQGLDKNGAYSPVDGMAQLFQSYNQGQQNDQRQKMVQQLLGQPAQGQ
jgi:hypothetical protein